MLKQNKLWDNEGTSCQQNNTIEVELDPELDKIYHHIERTCRITEYSKLVSYTTPVNFVESLNTPRHRWYPYKEGFSPTFVRGFYNRYCSNIRPIVLDPFSGVGTSVLESGLNGGGGLGLDTNELATFIATTKSTNLEPSLIDDFNKAINIFTFAPLSNRGSFPLSNTVLSYFEPEYLDALVRVKGFLEYEMQPKLRNLFKLAFLSIIEPFSTHRKAGNGLKRKTRLLYKEHPGTPMEQVRRAVIDQLRIYINDLTNTQVSDNISFVSASSLEVDKFLPHESYDCVLTSPPYANCFDYSKIYMCELWFGDFFTGKEDQRKFRNLSMRSHVHARWLDRYEEYGSPTVNNIIAPLLLTKELWSQQIPEMLQGYFKDLGRLLVSLSSMVKKDAPIGLVVGNSVYAGIPVATDLLLAELGGLHGLTLDGIEIFRHIVPSSQQFMKVSDKRLFRESMVVFRK